MKPIFSLSLLWAILLSTCFSFAGDFILLKDGKVSPIVLMDNLVDPLPAVAEMLSEDIASVTGVTPMVLNGFKSTSKKRSLLIAGTIGNNRNFDRYLKKNHIETASLVGAWEAYRLQVVRIKGQTHLLVLGSDVRGTAYGLLEVSRQIGVSPWVWWADAKPIHRDKLILPSDFFHQDKPSVQYRGIFLNDEDFGIQPWASQTLAPQSPKGAIGPEAYTRVFQLLLRLRANLIWPAMHETTVPFYFVPGNAEAAKKYGIYVGTSHCEPLMRNSAGEWDKAKMGAYDYSTNAENVQSYWRERVRATAESPCVYTIGMRGVHDGKMQGAESLADQKNLLQRVINDQRQMLSTELKKPAGEIPQVFIPYKEVLDVYNEGLEVPKDVTLIWCDDNYGNISRLSNTEERKRIGGSGIYYHISYWGRPHDYLWLASTSPAKIQFEMTRAWDQDARKLWVLNVGDIKPGEYLTEYFMDLAWNVGKSQPRDSISTNTPLYADHLEAFMAREFGVENAKKLSGIMQTYYHLANLRKPEHMGWTRVEESGYPSGRTPLVDTEFSEAEIFSRIKAYASLESQVRSINETLPGNVRPAFFQLVSYPVMGASQLNQKILYAQLSRQAEAKKLFEEAARYASASLYAYQEIQNLTSQYNLELCSGKWNRMMSSHPRDLFVFGEPQIADKYKKLTPKPILDTKSILRSSVPAIRKFLIPEEVDSLVSFNASIARKELRPSGLGHSLSAIRLKKGESLRFDFITSSRGKAELSIYSLPNYAVDGGPLRYEVRFNDSDPVQVNTKTQGRSEVWKLQVLRNQAVATICFDSLKAGRQTLLVTAMEDDVVLDQFSLDFKVHRKGYLLPATPVAVDSE